MNFKIIKIWPFLKVEKDAKSVAAFFFLATFFSKITTRPSTSFGTIILEINGHESWVILRA